MMRWPYWPPRRRYWVTDDDELVAANLSRRFALRYAEGRHSLHPERTLIVACLDRKGTLHVIAEHIGTGP